MCAALAAAVLVVYARVLGHDFVSIDDPTYVYENSVVLGGLDRVSAAWAFSGFHFSNWHPLTWLSYLLDVSLLGGDVGALLAENALLHAANAVLLFLALRAATGAFWASATVAALFALHPLRVESVAWVSSRKDVLSGLFAMLTLMGYVAYARRPSVLRYLGVASALALGLLAKPMLVTVPMLLLLLDAWPLQRWSRSRSAADAEPCARAASPRFAQRSGAALCLEKLPLLALALGSGVATVLAQRGAAVATLDSLPVAVRFANALVAYCTYLWKTFWPFELAFFYPHPAHVRAASALVAPAVAAFVVLGAASGVVWVQRRDRPYLAVGWLWFGISLLPVIGLFQVGSQALADRYTYLPLVGIYVAAVWAARDAMLRHEPVRRTLRVAVPVLLAGLAVASWVQVGTWRDSASLYEHALRVTRDNYLAHNNLGNVYRGRGEPERAAEQFEKSLAIRPEFAEVHANLGSVFVELGELERAEAAFEEALRLQPDYAEVHNDLGALLERRGLHEQAAEHFRKALRSRPDYALAHNNLGAMLREGGGFDEAAVHLERAAALAPDNADVYENLGALDRARGDLDRAVEHYERALELAPHEASTHSALGAVLVSRGDPARAVRHFERALELDPENTAAHNNLGVVYERSGDLPRAAAHLRRALALDPDNAETHDNLGIVLERGGSYADAASHYRRAIALAPRSANAYRNLGGLLTQLEKYDEARAYLDRALALAPDDAATHNNLGVVLLLTGEPEQAAARFERALELQPQLEQARRALEQIRSGEGER